MYVDVFLWLLYVVAFLLFSWLFLAVLVLGCGFRLDRDRLLIQSRLFALLLFLIGAFIVPSRGLPAFEVEGLTHEIEA